MMVKKKGSEKMKKIDRLNINIDKLKLLILKKNYEGAHNALHNRVRNNPEYYNNNQMTGEKSVMFSLEKI